MPIYRKKPVEVEAHQLPHDGKYPDELNGFLEAIGNRYRWSRLEYDGALVIHTYSGDIEAVPGDYIIKGAKGELYPCKPDIFEETYELVGDA